MKNLKNSTPAEKVLIVKKWVKPLLIVSSLVFVLWFFFAVFQEKNGGATTERIGGSGETSKRLRTEVRTWLRKTFPVSAARAAEQFGFFEMKRNELPVSRTEWVILAHGLDEPGNLWADMGPALAEMGFRVFEFRYPNDQPIHESSRFLHEQFEVLLNSFDSEKPPDGLHLIGHSMGGLVFRDFITHPDLLPTCLWTDQTPVLKLIHAGTPNHGSWLSTYRFPAELRDHLFKDYGMDAF
ncbi:MAG: hypothetical protein O7C75_18600, partial [Verrucomicrobia bacterium]|nr:hypothetical protein [Verrucomicrobiota bacterium]